MQRKRVKAEEPAITPEAYNLIVDALRPVDIRVVALSFRQHETRSSGPVVTFGELELPERDSELELPDSVYETQVSQRARFLFRTLDGVTVAEGDATFSVRLSIPIRAPVEFWSIFLHRNIKLYTHPVLRDIAASVAARAGIVAVPMGSISVAQTLTMPASPLPIAQPDAT